MHGQRDLRRDVDEPLAEEQAHGLGGVVQMCVQLFHQALPTALLTGAQDQLFNLLSTLGALGSQDKVAVRYRPHQEQKPERYHLLWTREGSPLPPPLKPACPPC